MSGLLRDELSKSNLNSIVLISIVIQTFPHISVLKSSDQSEIIQLKIFNYYFMELCIFHSIKSITISET